MSVSWEDFTAQRGPVAVYVQLADFIAGEIAACHLQKGDQLPSDRALAELVGHSVETAAKAKRLLVQRGLAATGRGLGVFIV